MVVDREGCLWVVFWDGWCLRRLSPDGATIATLPVQRPTRCAFGGEDLGQLFITAATSPLDDAARAAQPLAVGLFVVEPGVTGVPIPPFAG